MYQTSVNLPRDANSSVVPTLAASSDAVVASVTGTTGTVALPTSSLIVEISCLTAVHFKFGAGSVTATTSDRLLPAGAVVTYSIPRVAGELATHIAFVKATGATDGVVSVGALV